MKLTHPAERVCVLPSALGIAMILYRNGTRSCFCLKAETAACSVYVNIRIIQAMQEPSILCNTTLLFVHLGWGGITIKVQVKSSF